MTNNLAWGPFRRHFAFEGISNGISVGNISIGGATWWGEAYIMCSHVIVENTIKYTRTPEQKAGASWNPIRGAICIQNWSSHVSIRSMVYLDEGSAGAGVVLTRSSTVAGEHKLTLQVSMLNEGLESNNAFDLQPAENLHLNNCYAEGFAYQIKGVTAPYNNILLTGCRLNGNGSATGILFQGGSGGSLSIKDSIVDVTGSDYAMSLFDLAQIRITSTGIAANKYAVSLRDIGEKFIISNCYNIKSGESLALRYAKTNASGGSSASSGGDVPEIEWLFNDNEGINSGFYYSQAQLLSAASAVNRLGKSSGKSVLGYDVNKQLRYFYATGEAPTAPWAMLEIASSVITPA